MKIAVISDIHGNMEAIEAVFNDIEKQECEKIFVLGDYAMAGPEPQKAVEYFMNKHSDKNFSMIQGNTDFMISNFTEDLFNNIKSGAPVMANALKNDVLLLDEAQKSFLKNLPSQLEIEIEGVKFLLVHGSPRKNNENILPETTLSELEEMIRGVNADVILCGHTHMPCGFQTESKKTVVNVGSIGRPFTLEPKSCYLKINVINGECLFEHRFVEYDNKTASKKLLQRTFEGKEKLAQTLISPKERHF